ncbi:hypothetical protein AB205_0179460 [Aquarana catesbeiana]|uniref:Uncharacterized protein n=1 Tax=Aquarana catesbeiana TaxID=8400 RepID=A0A2G9QKT3_AQUCT|nr:hypothetical protein AB205_0179460 [Aquarana catesbeiana]
MTAPRKGFDYDGLGLLYWRLSRDPNFGSDREWRLEEIIEHRERRLNVSEGHWAQEDLEFLALQEWELEIAYRQLLDSAQQQGGAPFAWDYQEISVDNSEILVEESAVENLEIAIPKAEVLTTGQSSANLCPALTQHSGFHGQEIVNLHPQTPVAETGDLIDFSAEKEQPDEPPAEELQPDEGTEKEAASSPPQWQLHSLGGEIFSLLPQRLAEAYDVESPAEVLATGQTKLCPAMATTVDFQGAGAVGSSLQPQIT